MLQADTRQTSSNIPLSKFQRNPYNRLSILRKTWIASTANEHASAKDDAMAAPAISMSQWNMNSQLPGMFTNMAVRAAIFKAFVRVMPTRNERKARNGKENSSPQIRPSKYQSRHDRLPQKQSADLE